MKRDPVLNAVDLRVLTEDETRLPVVLGQSAIGRMRYRVGLRLLDPEPDISEAFCLKHGTNPFR